MLLSFCKDLRVYLELNNGPSNMSFCVAHFLNHLPRMRRASLLCAECSISGSLHVPSDEMFGTITTGDANLSLFKCNCLKESMKVASPKGAAA